MAQSCRPTWMNETFQPGLVSVIIPTYNRADLLGEALHSVREQTYRPIELVVVDDGSTDSTQQVARRFAEATAGDVHVRCIYQENQGAQAARNRGLAESRGEFIQFLDSDDLLHPEKLTAQVQAMRDDPQVRYVFSAWECLHTHRRGAPGGWPADFQPDRENLIDLMLFRDERLTLPLCTDNGLYRRSLCMRLGPWDTRVKRMQPRLYNLRLLLLGVRYRYLPSVHAWHRMHPGEQITDHGSEPAYLANMRGTWYKVQWLLDECGELTRSRRLLLARIYYATARPALIAGEARLGTELLGDGIAVAPPSVVGLKLRLTGWLYRALGLRIANRLFDLKMRLTGAGKAVPR